MLELGEEGRRMGTGAARTGRGPRPFIGVDGGRGAAASMAGHEGAGYTQ
jgi:hypothetical protein